MTGRVKVIAIDGPAGSGKSTVARKVAEKLNVTHIDTGAMFRAIGYYCDEKSIPFEESETLRKHLASMKMKYAKDDNTLIEINGDDLTQKIREHRVSELASKISKIPSVRHFLLEFQRGLPQNQTCTMEGRDIGTVVFPDAFCKIFLTATPEVRAQRRYDELLGKGDTSQSYEQILQDVKDRDYRDSNREIAPLKQADDAILVETSNLNIDQVVGVIVEKVRECQE